MPYIDKSEREQLDILIAALATEIRNLTKAKKDKTYFAGLLNYVCTRLSLQCLPEIRYWSLALVAGVFSTLYLEMYRRYIGPYEDQAIEKTADIPEYFIGHVRR